MKRVCLLFLSALFFSCGVNAAEKTVDLGWAVVSCPEKVGVGQKFTVNVTLKELPAGCKLGGDIHLCKADGSYGGYGGWGGNPRVAEVGKAVSFTYTMPAPKDDSAGIFIHYYLSPKGWDERVKDAPSPKIMLDGAFVDPNARPASATLKKSWFKFGKAKKGDGSAPGEIWTEEDELILPVEYYVDPADDWGGTQMKLWVMGPWVDCPDGKYTTKRGHQNYRGLDKNFNCEIGKVVKTEFKIKLPKPNTYVSSKKEVLGDSLLFIGFFIGKDGKNWPWQIRKGGLSYIARKTGYFELDTATPGNLFTYEQPVVVNAVLGNKSVGAGAKELKYTVNDQSGAEVASGAVSFNAEKAGQIVPIPLKLKQRGTFMISATVDGWEERATTFATIPDLQKVIGDNPTPFGCQKIAGNPEAVKVARMLGMSSCRVWTNWNELQPDKDSWNQEALAVLDSSLKDLNANNIRPWLLFDNPPAWVVDNPASWGTHFAPFPFRDADLRATLQKVGGMYKGEIIGFEWLNEIVPGKDCADPVGDYLRFCRVASATVKEISPELKNQLAGGLWPRSFRKSLLAAGIGGHVDILPVHYSTAAGVDEAENDLANVGSGNVVVWDNETARGWSTWKMPLLEAVMDNKQSDYFMSRFPDELLADCKQIVIFGGEPDPAGNWSHYWGDMSPRPATATLAVLVSKLALAKPLGEFSLGKGDSIKLFAGPQNHAVLVVSTIEKEGENVLLQCGEKAVKSVDQQGNESVLALDKGGVKLALSQSPYFVEGGDLDVLKAQLVLQFPGSASRVAQFSFVEGAALNITLCVNNLYDKPLSCTLRVKAEDGSLVSVETPITVKPGEKQMVALPLSLPKGVRGIQNLAVQTEFADGNLPVVEKRLQLNIISPDKVGNLLKNGGFEEAGDSDKAALSWGGTGRNGEREEIAAGNELGHEKYVYHFSNADGKYQSIFQSRKEPDAGEYVYSFWIKSQNLQTGSNVSLTDEAGKAQTLSWMRIFNAPSTQEYWDVFYARFTVKAGTKGLACAPVCKGSGNSYIDNAVLSLYEGTEYTACVPEVTAAITVDANLDDFKRSNPIPLLGKSQLRTATDKYKWSPENLSGVAYLNWDANNLYLGIEVIDDKMVAEEKEEKCVNDDSIELAIHPLNRQAGQDSKAFVYYISAAAPGGSGKHTIYRPEEHSGGLKSGSLAKDSSTYDISVKRTGTKTVYELAIPLSDLGGIRGEFGTKFGLSLALNDNDGNGTVATMLWGEGLLPAWSPRNFGMATLVGKK